MIRSAAPRSFLALVLVAAACGGRPDSGRAGIASSSRPDGSILPNVLFITVDTLRADRLETYGSTTAITPNIDALARNGVVFERAYATFPKTNPALASLMTGRYPSAHGVRRNGARLPEPELTLAEILQAAGYETASFISNHVMLSRCGLSQGFILYDEDLPDPIQTREARERTARRLVDGALDWAGARPSGPLFLWVHFIDPHGPYTPPGFEERFRPADPEGATLHVSETDAGVNVIPAYQALPGVDLIEEYIARYDGEVEYMDAEVGRLLEGLREAGLTDGAVILFASDHGESLGDHGLYFQHGSSLYEAQIRIPLIMVAPGAAPHAEPAVVSTVDVMPTVLEILGLPIPRGLQGTSLVPLLSGSPTDGAGRVVFAELDRYYAGIEGSEKVIWRAGAKEMDLHDLLSDPGERADVASERPESGRRLLALVSRFARENTRDVAPSTDEQTAKVLKSLGYIE